MRLFWIISALLLVASLSFAGDWPGFLGPTRDGISPEKGLATSWPEGGPKELWSFKLGVGYGGATVKGGKVYVQDREGNEKDVLHCLELATGEDLWSVSANAPGIPSYSVTIDWGDETTTTTCQLQQVVVEIVDGEDTYYYNGFEVYASKPEGYETADDYVITITISNFYPAEQTVIIESTITVTAE
jgi:hypothetical protein